ncbi:acyltransferase [Streptomyces sp. NBC_00285]|uniref:acyltransferase family protein n=1 Tax=Streptomyces sp. NBC_00285 TaxID=2975700 RepID=UPI002E27BEFE|nr:acyltransferase [Streptomyces sp. NBC_00285]
MNEERYLHRPPETYGPTRAERTEERAADPAGFPAVFAGPAAAVPFVGAPRLPARLTAPAPDPVPARDSADETSGSRFSAVDGLRGAAVLTVLLYDTGVGGRWFSWTGAGVDVLLVLTGFLTTLPLIRRATATGTTGVLGFLTRRAKRMIPALLVSVAATFAACWALGPPGVVRDLARQAASALPGHGEWADWLRGSPLGAVPTTDSPLAPLWLGDVTARSVLVWSLLLACVGLLARRRLAAVTLVVALLTGAAIVAAARGMLPGVVTDLRALALPAGAGAACLVHLVERGGRAVSRPAAALTATTGLAAAAALAVSAVLRGGGPGENRYVVAVALAAALLTAVLCTGRGPLARLLSTDLLTEVGRMSYSLFLLHLPVYWLLRRGQPGLSHLALFLVGGVVTWFLSLLVHYLLMERLAGRSWRSR